MTKKITLALAMIGLSASAFAGAPGNQVAMPSGVNLIAPDSVGVWSIGLEAQYSQVGHNDAFQYAQVTNSGQTNPTVYSNKAVDRDNDWGGSIDIAYLFPGNSRDVKLSYTHANFDDSNSYTNVANDTTTNPFGLTSLTAAGNIAKGTQDTTYNDVDLVFGQWIKIGDRVDLHPFGGLRWAQVDTDAKGSYTTTATSLVDTGKISSDFQGLGPRVGIDGAVHLGSGFSIVGTAGASLLVGDLDSKITTFDDTTSTDTTTVYKNDNDNHVIPELDARLGLDYMYAFSPTTSLNVQVGYQVVNYFGVSELSTDDTLNTNDGINSVVSSEDFGFHGPYLRLQLNVA